MVTLIPQRARLHDVLSLQRLIDGARDDLIRARHHLADARQHARLAELALGTTERSFDSVVAIYNRLVVEYEPETRRTSWNGTS